MVAVVVIFLSPTTTSSTSVAQALATKGYLGAEQVMWDRNGATVWGEVSVI